MRVPVVLGLAIASLAVARQARVIAKDFEQHASVPEPYAPSPRAAPFLSIGFREAAADLMFVRLRGYFGDERATPVGVTELCESTVALDPRFHRIYEFCGGAITFSSLTNRHADQSIPLRAIALLERGRREFPKDWRLPNLAGQIYTQDLQTDDPRQRRIWDEKGMALVEEAIRKPGAPANLQDWAAVMRTKYGQQQRAIRDLREVLLVTTDTKARKTLIARLAQLQNENEDEIAGEIFEARRGFEREWRGTRPLVPPTWYILLGPPLPDWFDLTDLAVGGRNLVTSSPVEKLEPLE